MPNSLYQCPFTLFLNKWCSWNKPLKYSFCREYLKDDSAFYVPEVIPDLTTKHVLTSELVNGVTLDKIEDIDQPIKNKVCNF